MKKILSKTLLAGLVLVPLACAQNLNELPPPTAEMPAAKDAIQRKTRLILDEVSGDAPVRLYLAEQAAEPQQVAVRLGFFLTEDRPGPRMAEVYLKTSSNLKFASVQPGTSADGANKDVVGQERDNNQVRLTVFSSSNLNTLASGFLAEVVFDVLQDDATEATIEIVPSDAMLAPPVSGEGLELGAPLVLSL